MVGFSYFFKQLKALIMTNFKCFTKVSKMDYIFNNCKSLTSISLPNLDTILTIAMIYIFNGYNSVQIIPKLNSQNLKDYSCMLMIDNIDMIRFI